MWNNSVFQQHEDISRGGHQGCVNCLEWNDKGTLLASGSDDRSIIVWDPFERNALVTMGTDHTANIFAENYILSGAADGNIFMHDVGALKRIRSFPCCGRIKRIAYTSSEPFLFWSASEAGTCRQYDLRESQNNGTASYRNVLVHLRSFGDNVAEAKSVAVNFRKPELIALGSNEPYVRVFDRRTLTLCAQNETMESSHCYVKSQHGKRLNPLQYYVPAHLASKVLDQDTSDSIIFDTTFTTTVCFSPNGQELLANIGRDNIYLFDLNKPRQPYQCSTLPNIPLFESDRTLFTLGQHNSDRQINPAINSVCIMDKTKYANVLSKICQCDMGRIHINPAPTHKLFRPAQLVEAKAFTAAVMVYNELIYHWPSDPQLYIGRATALFKRNWKGDIYAAFLDCQTTMRLIQQYSNSFNLKQMMNEVGDRRNDYYVSQLKIISIYLTAVLLAIRCVYILKWLGVCRILLKRTMNFLQLFDNSNRGSLQSNNSNQITINNVFYQVFERLYLKVMHKLTDFKHTTLSNSFLLDSDCSMNNKSSTTPQFDDSNKHDHKCKKRTKTALGNSHSWCFNPNPWDPELDWTEFDHSDPSVCICPSCSYDCFSTDAHQNDIRLKRQAFDYTTSYMGHCNLITDIKEANFFGSNGQYIVGGSDCGSFFIWDRHTSNIVRILKADSSTVNCVQPHPSVCALASSGIDSVVRLWSPNCEEDPNETRVVKDQIGIVERNQEYSNIDPMDIMLYNIRRTESDYEAEGRSPSIDSQSSSTRNTRLFDCERSDSSTIIQTEGTPENVDKKNKSGGHISDKHQGDGFSRSSTPTDIKLNDETTEIEQSYDFEPSVVASLFDSDSTISETESVDQESDHVPSPKRKNSNSRQNFDNPTRGKYRQRKGSRKPDNCLRNFAIGRVFQDIIPIYGVIQSMIHTPSDCDDQSHSENDINDNLETAKIP